MTPQLTREVSDLRRQLNALNAKVSGAASSLAVAQALQQYLAAGDRLFLALSARSSSQPAGGYVPGGAVVSAAISSLGKGGSGSSGA